MIRKIEGTFQGKNLYIHNPMTEEGFCTYSVIINDTIVLDSVDIMKSAFEIDFKGMGFRIDDTLRIQLLHYTDCSPKVLGP